MHLRRLAKWLARRRAPRRSLALARRSLVARAIVVRGARLPLRAPGAGAAAVDVGLDAVLLPVLAGAHALGVVTVDHADRREQAQEALHLRDPVAPGVVALDDVVLRAR